MKAFGVLLSVVLLQIVVCVDDQAEVPEPIFEVFSPRGLKISIPDFKDAKSVEFIVNVPGYPDTLNQFLNQTNGYSWVFWKPDVVLHLYDKIQYKILVHHGTMQCTREGTYVVQKVLPLSGSENEEEGQKIISGFSSLDNIDERHRGMISTGKTSNLKSSYSMHKNSELKPITKSSMSTTSGTFYVKPSGVMEATGYKSGSLFDSTKREGEQWQHYKSELTAEELENMKNLYGASFDDFPHLTGGLFPSTRGKVYQKSYMSSESKTFPSGLHSVSYEESPVTTHKFHQTHKTHESSSFSHSKPVFQFHYTDSAGGNGDSLMETSRKSEKLYKMEPFQQLPNPLPPQGTIFKATEFVREEHMVPVSEISQGHVVESHSNSAPQKIVQVSKHEEFSTHNQERVQPVLPKLVQVSKHEEFSTHNQERVQPVLPKMVQVSKHEEFSTHNQGIITPVLPKTVQVSKMTTHEEFSTHNQERVQPVLPKLVQVSKHEEFSTHNQERTQPVLPKVVQVSKYEEFSNQNQERVTPVLPKLVGGRGDQMEYNSGTLETVERQDQKIRHYLGSIFTSVKTTKVKHPKECDLIPGVDYSATGNIREVEKQVNELQCLATLAESTMKEELALLRQKNGELTRKMESLEHEVRRLVSNCNCYE